MLNANSLRRFAAALTVMALAACSSVPRTPVPATPPTTTNPANQTNPSTGSASRLPILPRAGSGRGGYYLDDGPGDQPPDGLLDLPDAIPKIEPYASTGNKPYVVFGKTYTPMLDQHPFKQRGIGSWYGKKFHGKKTSSGELYDMYKLTAAHPTLPIPSYARVTNLSNGAQVIVRINDRGPFHTSRIIDLSYTAALKLGYLGKGSSELEVERLLFDDIARMNADRQQTQGVVARADTSDTAMSASAVPPPTALAVPLPDGHTAQQAPLEPAVSASDATSSAAVPVAIASGTGDFYLQLGAFGEAKNAEASRARLMQNWDASLPPPEINFVGVLYRLISGPFSSRAEAMIAAQKLQVAREIKAMIVQH